MKWPGKASPRNLTHDQVTDLSAPSGLLTSAAHCEEVTAALLAGAPPDVRLKIVWSYDEQSQEVKLRAVDPSPSPDVEIERIFNLNADGNWEVEHSLFWVAKRYRSSGGAVRMLRASVEAYAAMNVAIIAVHANIDVGGYVWAKLGFAASSPDDVREQLKQGLSDNPDSEIFKAAAAVEQSATNDELMYELARLRGSDDESISKDLLRNSDWYGYLDLTNPRHCERLAENFEGE